MAESNILDQCWEWNGARTSAGYGHKAIKKRLVHTHRLSWEWVHGPIPEGLCVLHACDNRACCNPNHLFLGTKKDNLHDAMRKNRWVAYNKLKTHCKRGHAFDEINTDHRPNGKRRCRTCHRLFSHTLLGRSSCSSNHVGP